MEMEELFVSGANYRNPRIIYQTDKTNNFLATNSVLIIERAKSLKTH